MFRFQLKCTQLDTSEVSVSEFFTSELATVHGMWWTIKESSSFLFAHAYLHHVICLFHSVCHSLLLCFFVFPTVHAVEMIT